MSQIILSTLDETLDYGADASGDMSFYESFANLEAINTNSSLVLFLAQGLSHVPYKIFFTLGDKSSTQLFSF